MNREIKFRGINSWGRWIYGDLLQNNGNPIIVQQVTRKYIETQDAGVGKYWHINTPAYYVVLESVGRLTGLTDKNGKEVYEGDIIRDHRDTHGNTYEIEFKSRLGAFEGTGINTGWTFSAYNLPLYGEVIGNRFEHPHLLK